MMFEVISEEALAEATKDQRHRGLTKRWLTEDLPSALKEQKVPLPVTINATGTGTPFAGKENLQTVYANLSRNITENDLTERYEVIKVKDKGVYLKIKG